MRSIVYKLVVCLLFVGSLVWYARLNFYRDPGSAFFDSDRAYEERYSLHRKKEVQHFIKTFDDTKEGHLASDSELEPPTLCVALSSVARENAQYLEMTVGSLLFGLSPEERRELSVEILIAEPTAHHHASWDSEWLRAAVDGLHTYNLTAAELKHLEDLQQPGGYSEKGVYDYGYAMQLCHETGAPYVGMFEDDILLADGWLVRTLLALRQIATLSPDKKWLFMRLFNQERSTGWAGRGIGRNNENWIVLAIGLGVSIPAYLARQRYRWARTWIDQETLLVVVTVLNPALVILFYQCGKASLLPPSPGVFSENFGCCSQALIFPRGQVRTVLDYLQERKEGQVDMMFKYLAIDKGLERLALYPVQAQHIGVESARNTTKEEAQAIWSMAYEDLDPAALERAHRNMLEEYSEAHWPVS